MENIWDEWYMFSQDTSPLENRVANYEAALTQSFYYLYLLKN